MTPSRQRLATLDESALMDEVQAGRIDAFSALYDRYCHRAYRVAVAICRDEGHAQDAVQEAFVSVWKQRCTYRAERGTAAGWVMSIVRHRAIDVARRNQVQVGRQTDDGALVTLPGRCDLAADMIQHEEADRLRSMLPLLPANQQEVIVLSYFGQLSHTEIAAQLRVPAGTVKGRMRLGLQKLRTSVERREP